MQSHFHPSDLKVTAAIEDLLSKYNGYYEELLASSLELSHTHAEEEILVTDLALADQALDEANAELSQVNSLFLSCFSRLAHD